jgi:protein-histidine pros-kinase
MEHKDGRIVWTGETLRAVDRPGQGILLQGFLRDVTDRKGLELHLWRTEERLRAMVRRAPDALVLTEPDGVIVDMNDQAVALLGYERADVVGSAIDHLLPERLRDRLADLRQAFERYPERQSVLDGQAWTIERSDGSEVPVELSMSLVPGSGRGPQILCSVHDLTVRRRAEVHARPAE